jgi:cell division protein FtsB
MAPEINFAAIVQAALFAATGYFLKRSLDTLERIESDVRQHDTELAVTKQRLDALEQHRA